MGVVIVGLIINLIAMYFKPHMDRLIGSISSRYRGRNEKKASARARQIRILRADPHEQVMLALSVNHHLLRSLSFVLLGIFCIVIVLAVPEIISWIRILVLANACFVSVLGSMDAFGALSKRVILREARETPATESREIS